MEYFKPLPERLVDSQDRCNCDGKTVFGFCSVNCEGRCVLRFHMKDDGIDWVESDNLVEDGAPFKQIRACQRGRSIKEWIDGPARLLHPLKRVGRRGEGKFERISWDEALDTVADELARVVSRYGNEAVYINFASGVMTANHLGFLHRFMNMYGGCLGGYGDYSHSQIDAALPYMYGERDSNTPGDVVNSKLLVLFGDNSFETKMCGASGAVYLRDAVRKADVRVVVIDPRLSETAATCADEWIAIRPGTDGALAAALAYVLITEDLVDREFIARYTVGFDASTVPAGAQGGYKEYIMGQGSDGVAKTPAWASAITGVPRGTIVKLAREIGSAKPCAIYQGKGPQRQSNGEQTARAIAALCAITGNVGIPGGNTGSEFQTYRFFEGDVPSPDNPVSVEIPVFLWTDAVARGPQMTAARDGVRGADRLSCGIKFLWNVAGNAIINQHSNINRTHEILQDESACEFIVCVDTAMTSSARYADIVLPDLFPVEQPSIIASDWAGDTGYVLANRDYLPAKGECKTLYRMLAGVAERLGFADEFTEGKSEEEWRCAIYEAARAADAELPPYEQLLETGVYRRRNPEGHHVAFADFRRNPRTHPLATPSGKIELYSQRILDDTAGFELADDEVISPLPVYAAPFDERAEGEQENFPFLLTGFHHRARAHSSYAGVDVLRCRSRQQVWVNDADAQRLGVANGQVVRVFNHFGEVRVEAKVTPRIMPGVCAMGEGAWHDADMFGNKIDVGGCINTLTSSRPSPLAKGNPQHTNYVQIARIE